MKLFDFIFGKNTKLSELDANTKSDDNVYKKQDNKRQKIDTVEPFVFKSNCHQRYENGQPVMGLQKCMRTVSVEKNTKGCKGYRLNPGIGYIVKIYNDDIGRANMSDKPMKVVRKTGTFVELRGFPIEAMSPFGWQEVDYSDYGFFVYYKNSQIEKCVLHMYDRNVRIEYIFNSSIKMDDRYTKMVKNATFNPFNITCEEHLQATISLPSNFKDVFIKELNELYMKISYLNGLNKKDMIKGYAFNLAESYYNNAGYVPKNALDQILEQVYAALLETNFKDEFKTLDDSKYECYYGFLNN